MESGIRHNAYLNYEPDTLPYFKSCLIRVYEGQSEKTEPYLITFEFSKMDIYLDNISLKLYVIYLIT